MARGVGLYLVAPLVALGLVSCRDFGFEARDPWRAEAEERCLADKRVEPSAYVEPESSIEGRGACGMTHPFKVSAMSGGYVTVEPRATLGCPIIGDPLYAPPDDKAERLMLAAIELAFDHPRSGKRMQFKADLPAPMRRLLKS